MPFRILSLLPFFMLFSCLPLRDISTVNMASSYRVADQKFHPEFVLYNESDSTARLYLKVLPAEFLFVRQDDEKFRANLRVRAEIIQSIEMAKLIDSSSAEFSFDLSDKSNVKVLSFTVPAPSGSLLLAHIFLQDVNKGTIEDYFVSLDRLSIPSRQDFLVKDGNDELIFRDYLHASDSVSLLCNRGEIEISCKYYRRDFPLAPPPFSFDVREEFNYRPDSLFTIKADGRSLYSFPGEGFYHFQTDTAGKSGLTLFRFTPGFPDIVSPKQMIESLRYLLMKREYDEMKINPSPKAAVEGFWMKHGGNEEKSRRLIKKYYGRVREANKFFTSYTEGWRTDRGLIYIIYGSPGTIYRSNESETWIYGTPNSSLALSFFFIKVNNPFTENDYMLSRSSAYESAWYRAVEIWRQGRAYNSFN